MKTIYKYEVCTALQIPAGAQLLHVGEQDGRLVMWARVDTLQPVALRRLEVVGTGWVDRDGGDGAYLGTIQASGGLVWHIFDQGEQG